MNDLPKQLQNANVGATIFKQILRMPYASRRRGSPRTHQA